MRVLFFASLMLLVPVRQVTADTLLVLPVPLAKVSPADQETINELFVDACMDYFSDFTVVAGKDTNCVLKDCALERASRAGADEVIFGKGRKLGRKWIVVVYRYRVKGEKKLASYRLDGTSVEDLEYVMRRLARALAEGLSIEKSVTIDNVTEIEMDPGRHRRRTGFHAMGLKFGLMYPLTHASYRRKKFDYSSGSNPSSTEQLPQILSTDWVNWFELPRNIALQWDIHVGWGAELGTHFSLLKLFSRGDYVPFAGAGVGLDHVFVGNSDSGKRHSGFALSGRGGMLLFRTYDFRIHTELGGKAVFTSDLDAAAFANLGITWKRNQRRGSTPPGVRVLSVIGGVVVGLLFFGVVMNTV